MPIEVRIDSPSWSTIIINFGARFRKEFCSSPIPSHQKKGRPSIVPGLPFLVHILNAAFFRTPDLAMVSNGKKQDNLSFHHCLDCHYILLNFKASWSSYCFWSLTSSFIKRLVTAS